MKKYITLTLTAILLFAGFASMACDFQERPLPPKYILTVALDKTEASIGDTVTVTVVFKNITGKDIEAELPGWIAERGGKNKEDILYVFFDNDVRNPWLHDYNSLFEPRPKIFIEKEDRIERKFEYTVTESGYLYIIAGAFFIDSNVNPYGTGIQILNHPVKITVIQEQ